MTGDQSFRTRLLQGDQPFRTRLLQQQRHQQNNSCMQKKHIGGCSRDTMAQEQATGHYLEKRVGGGDSRSSFGGSLFLVDAKLRNTHMDHDFSDRDDDLGRQRDSRMRHYIRERNSLRDELHKLARERKQVTYFHADTRDLRQQVREGTLRIKDGRQQQQQQSHVFDRQNTLSHYAPSFFEDSATTRMSGNLEGLNLSPRESGKRKRGSRTRPADRQERQTYGSVESLGKGLKHSDNADKADKGDKTDKADKAAKADKASYLKTFGLRKDKKTH